MNKICTDVKQSRRFIELGIDINTADMQYMYRHWEIDETTVGAQSDASIGFDSDFYYGADNGKTYHYIPAWSLAALLSILPNNEHVDTTISRGGWKIDTIEYMPNTWWCEYEDNENSTYFNTSADNPVDACYEMIIKLKELNLL